MSAVKCEQDLSEFIEPKLPCDAPVKPRCEADPEWVGFAVCCRGQVLLCCTRHKDLEIVMRHADPRCYRVVRCVLCGKEGRYIDMVGWEPLK